MAQAISIPSEINIGAPDQHGNCFEAAFCASPLAQLIIETSKLCIVEANPAAAELLGLACDQIVGLELTRFFPDEFTIDIFMARLPGFEAAGAPTLGRPFNLNLRRPDKGIIQTETSCVTCRLVGGHPGFLVQMSENFRRAGPADQTAPMEQSVSQQHLLECIGDGFVALNEQDRVVYANAAAARTLGKTRRGLLGCAIGELFPKIDHQDLARAAVSAGDSSQAHPVRLPVFFGCELHHFEFNIHPFQGGLGVLFRDISQSIKQEMEIAKLNATMAVSQELLRSKNEELNTSLEALAQLNEQLANADALKSEFLANTSHELRTPLNSIIGFLQLISEGLCENREEEQEYIRNALSSGQHLLALINDVLDIAKIEAGKMTLLIDDVDMDIVFHEVFAMTHVQAQQKRLDLSFEIKDEAQRIVRADFHKVKQVMINLVGNSIKFTPAGYVRVWAETDPERSDMMRIAVQDSGIGVPPNQQQRIFEKFMQVDGKSTRKYQGTGLGLTISQNLVDMMGGSIGIQSEGEDKGATMYFTLPLALSARPAPSRNAENSVEELLPKTF